MVTLDGFARKAAYAVAAGQQHPSTVDARKLELLGDALDKLYAPGASARELLIADLASNQETRVAQYCTTIAARIGTSVTASDLLRAGPYMQVLSAFKGLSTERAREVEAAFEKRDLGALERTFQDLGIEAKPAWAARLFQRLPKSRLDGVALRGDSVAQARTLTQELAGLADQIVRSESGDAKSALREQAAEVFASLVNVVALMDGKTRYDSGIDLAKTFEMLAIAGVQGFLPSHGGAEFEVLGQRVSSKFDLKNPVVQLVAVPLGLETRGHDPSRYLPGHAEPAIPVATDRVHLGTEDRPIGYVSKDGRHAVVPQRIDLVLINRAPYGPIGHFGFGEMPIGAFEFETRFYGASLRVPLEVEVGGVKLALRHGEYRASEGSAKISYAPNQVRIEANGEIKTIDTLTGAIA